MIDNPAVRRVMAMHQINYIPWLGYFHKMAHADVFVYLDTVQYPRGKSVSARNEIKTPQGRALLTVPVSIPRGHDGKASYTDVTFADEKWREKHLRTLAINYGKAPFFDEIYAMLAQHVSGAGALLDLNIGIIEDVAHYLGLHTERVRMSMLGDKFGPKSELIVDLCRATGATTYLSGTGGGRDYNDERLLASEGISLEYCNFDPPEYTQLWGAFEPRLSAVDALFNLGPATRDLLGI
jgi:hypothetical protein